MPSPTAPDSRLPGIQNTSRALTWTEPARCVRGPPPRLVLGGIDPRDATQHQPFEGLAAAEMVTPGGIIDRFHDNVLYSLRMLPEL
ncbi:hypothetical protein ABZ802_33555 [Streptomyces sp. NPDC047737]|uniref:hypothetical protein n=1 Tax=unclassified Streptomyces TaxID=2593676 RepID=UPI0033D23BF3